MEILSLTVVGGLIIGVVYALAGASMVVIYRTSGYISFCQGDIAAVSLFVALWAYNSSVPYALVAVITVIVGALLAAAIGTFVVVPIERFGHIHAVLATIAVGLVIQGVENVTVGGRPRDFPSAGKDPLFQIGVVTITPADAISLLVSAAIFIALGLLFSRTHIGIAMRAVNDSPEASEVLGVNAAHLRRVSWLISGALAGVAGLFIAPTFGLTPYSVNAVLIFAFCAVVVGGFESIVGALVAGIGVGVVSNLVVAYADPNLVSTAVYVLLLTVLLLRPNGLFGRRPIVRV